MAAPVYFDTGGTRNLFVCVLVCVYIVLIMPCEATSHRMLQLPYVQVCYRPPLYTIKDAPACNMAAVLASEQLTACL